VLDVLQFWQDVKQVILSVAQVHLSRKEAERKVTGAGLSPDDSSLGLTSGKGGEGLFILLHGVPGIGKTSTAEAMARALGKPLFHIHIGSLAVTTEDLDTSLDRIFRLAAIWDCILTLDEVDLFFSRAATAGENLLSVFLQKLENYDGILFLTTSHGNVDSDWGALTSRMHYVIHYPPLTLEQTLNIWRLNIECVREDEAKFATPIQIHEDDLLTLAEELFRRNSHKPWNGRQIRHAFQVARSLAYYDYGYQEQQQLEYWSSSTEPISPPRLDRRYFETINDEWPRVDNAPQSDSTSYTELEYESSVEEFINPREMVKMGPVFENPSRSLFSEIHPQHRSISAPIQGVSELQSENDGGQLQQNSTSVNGRAESQDDSADTSVQTPNITSTSSNHG